MSVPLSEREYMKQVVELARQLDWTVRHIPNCKTQSGRWSNQSATGLPDLILIRPPRLLMVELKGRKTEVTAEQVRTLYLLGQCDGVESYLWRSGEATLQAIADVLSSKTAVPSKAKVLP